MNIGTIILLVLVFLLGVFIGPYIDRDPERPGLQLFSRKPVAKNGNGKSEKKSRIRIGELWASAEDALVGDYVISFALGLVALVLLIAGRQEFFASLLISVVVALVTFFVSWRFSLGSFLGPYTLAKVKEDANQRNAERELRMAQRRAREQVTVKVEEAQAESTQEDVITDAEFSDADV